jgi:hypothetical protein
MPIVEPNAAYNTSKKSGWRFGNKNCIPFAMNTIKRESKKCKNRGFFKIELHS